MSLMPLQRNHMLELLKQIPERILLAILVLLVGTVLFVFGLAAAIIFGIVFILFSAGLILLGRY